VIRRDARAQDVATGWTLHDRKSYDPCGSHRLRSFQI
jgi:hypothetical protein